MDAFQSAVAGRDLDLAHDEVDDAVPDVVFVGDVVVQGHRLNPELLTEPAHRERLEPTFVGQAHGRAHHAVPGQGNARLGAGVGLRGDLSRPLRSYALNVQGKSGSSLDKLTAYV